jgi:hypothetical protein
MNREDDLDRELRDHLDLEAEDRAATGLAPADARAAAARAFGSVALVKEDTREAWGTAWVEPRAARPAVRGAHDGQGAYLQCGCDPHARAVDIGVLVGRQALAMVVGGIVVGLGAAGAAAQWMRSLYVFVALVAAVAIAIPLARATHIEPAAALRQEH